MSDCKKFRSILEEWEDLPSILPILASGLITDSGHPKYAEAVRHVSTCQYCQSWFKEQDPDKEERQVTLARIEKYCCTRMYCAVETNEDDELQLGLVHFCGDMIWIVKNFDDAGGNSLINYCPWCGTKLSSKPFVDG